MSGDGWHEALAYALVGECLGLPPRPAPDSRVLVSELAARGWDAGRIGAHARTVLDAGGVWPHPVPAPARAGLGAAQLHAVLGQARDRLGLTLLEVRPPSTRTTLDADERRLLAERPPHFGRL